MSGQRNRVPLQVRHSSEKTLSTSPQPRHIFLPRFFDLKNSLAKSGLDSVSEIERILATIDLSKTNGLRDRAILEVLYACGLRVSELINLKRSNLYFHEGYITAVGKGNKERLVPIGDDAMKHLKFYLDDVRARIKTMPDYENFVFLNNRGKPLSRIWVFLIIKEAAKVAEIDKIVSPHTFRHSFATHLIEGGADLKVVQDLLGHESITTTEVYTHLDTDYLRETVLMFHPRNRRKEKNEDSE